jgi:hypothetical protein
VLISGTPVPTDAVPVTGTGPGGRTAPFAGVLMATEMLVPPGRLPSTAWAGPAMVITTANDAITAPAALLRAENVCFIRSSSQNDHRE